MVGFREASNTSAGSTQCIVAVQRGNLMVSVPDSPAVPETPSSTSNCHHPMTTSESAWSHSSKPLLNRPSPLNFFA
ncbi:hypothetical protein BGW80DRAFT_1341962, partial [Lactifluus volemus]